MPELPEVELVARFLRPQILGRRIAHVETTAPSYFFLSHPTVLAKKLANRTVESLERKGKYLLLTLDSREVLLLHLGMTGQLFVSGARNPRLLVKQKRQPSEQASTGDFVPDKHTHLAIHFADGRKSLYFRDTRKFGKVLLIAKGQSNPRLSKLGPDALSLRAEALVGAARKRRVAIKSLLLDQTAISGVGNIYADEALFLASIHPMRPALSLSSDDCARLAATLRRILKNSIAAGGSSIDDYVHPDGSDGAFQKQFNVYGRTGEPCHRCNMPIERILLGQRATHFCPQCQPQTRQRLSRAKP